MGDVGIIFSFFFQAEDGIRDHCVTGVQTCALPICEGESEGEEQAEADLETNAEFRDDAPSDAERQIEDTIEQADQPSSGETPEPLVSEAEEPGERQETFLPPEPPPEGESGEGEGRGPDDSDDWRTWSG